MNKIDTAKKMFSEGFNCAQTVYSLFSEKYGVPYSIALKTACGFGGGVRCAQICGAVTGAVMVIGLKYGHTDGADTENKKLCYEKTSEFLAAFKEKNKSVVCRDLLGCNIFAPNMMQLASDKGLFETVCVDMVCDAVDLLEQLGY